MCPEQCLILHNSVEDYIKNSGSGCLSYLPQMPDKCEHHQYEASIHKQPPSISEQYRNLTMLLQEYKNR
jgi:hypothetical protein